MIFIFVFLAILCIQSRASHDESCADWHGPTGHTFTSMTRDNRTYYPFRTICYVINVPDENGTDSLHLYLQFDFVASSVNIYESYASGLCNTHDVDDPGRSCCHLGRSITAFVPTTSVAGEFIQTHGISIVTPQTIYDLKYASCTIDSLVCPDFDGYITYTRKGEYGGQCTHNQTISECEADCTADPLCVAFDYAQDCCLWTSHFSEFRRSCSTCSYDTAVVVPAPGVAPMIPEEARTDVFYVEYDSPGLSSGLVLEPMTEYYVLHGRYWDCDNYSFFSIEDEVQVDVVETSSYDCRLLYKDLYNWECPEECDDDFCPFGAVCTLTCPGELTCATEHCETEIRCVEYWDFINETIEEPICAQAIHCGEFKDSFQNTFSVTLESPANVIANSSCDPILFFEDLRAFRQFDCNVWNENDCYWYECEFEAGTYFLIDTQPEYQIEITCQDLTGKEGSGEEKSEEEGEEEEEYISSAHDVTVVMMIFLQLLLISFTTINTVF